MTKPQPTKMTLMEFKPIMSQNSKLGRERLRRKMNLVTKISSLPPIWKLQILTHFQPRIPKREGKFENHNDIATQTLKPISQQVPTTATMKF